MTNLRREMLKLKATKWRNLTLGEKVLKVILGLVKWGLIITVGLAAAGVVLSVVLGAVLAFAVVGAIADGFDIAANAYRPGDVYVRFR